MYGSKKIDCYLSRLKVHKMDGSQSYSEHKENKTLTIWKKYNIYKM